MIDANQYRIGGNQVVQPNGALTSVTLAPTAIGQGGMGGNGMLSNAGAVSPSTGIFNNLLGNSRMNAPLAIPAGQRIGMNEMLIRMGGNVAGASARGGLAALEAATDTYGQVQDYNRARGLAEYNAQVNAINKLNKTNKNKQKPMKGVSAYNQIVIEDLDRAISMLEKNHNFNKDTGEFGSDFNFLDNVTGFGTTTAGEMFAGTPAADFAALIETIKGNIGFDRLQKMREESPTGGALGQVSNLELTQLNNVLGNLKQTQSPQQLRQNMLRIKEQYIKTVRALEEEYAAAGIDISDQIADMNLDGNDTSDRFSQADSIVGN